MKQIRPRVGVSFKTETATPHSCLQAHKRLQHAVI